MRATGALDPVHRTSVSGQGDADGFVAIGTFVRAKKAGPLTSYEVAVDLEHVPGSTAMILDHWGAGPTAAEPTAAELAAFPGAANWPFNTAYAAGRGLTGFVTRLRSLAEAERSSAAGDVISNDPAVPTNAEVHKVYGRADFEEVWLGGSAGIVYVIHPDGVALPPSEPGLPLRW